MSVYTLFSLALVRLQSRTLTETASIENFREVATLAIKNPKVSNFNKNFVSTFLSYLDSNNPPRSEALLRIYKLKTWPRTGWNDRQKGRHTVSPECVASHIFAAVAIAQCYLPSTPKVKRLIAEKILDEQRYREYDKSKIIENIVCHDIGEYEFGDIISRKKKPKHRQQEKSAVMKISLLTNCYTEVPNLLADPYETVYKPWKTFTENTDRSDINARIAYEIDKLEFLVQSIVYNLNPKNELPDFHQAHNEVKSKLEDHIVLQIYSSIVAPLVSME